jgi:hypothetical protein
MNEVPLMVVESTLTGRGAAHTGMPSLAALGHGRALGTGGRR